MKTFDEKEFEEIKNKFNKKAYLRNITIKCIGSSFFTKMKKSAANNRRGEVVFCVIRPNGKIVTITRDVYPAGIFRIPSGGVAYGEDITEAVSREVKEELGIDIEITGFPGAFIIRFEYEKESTMFFSYLFILKETKGRLLIDASDDEISEVKEAGMEEFEAIVSRLRDIEGEWRDWGRFRYETSNAIMEYLKKVAYPAV